MTRNDFKIIIDDYLNTLKDKNTIVDGFCSDFKIENVTWEDLYPNQFHRHSAIMANELYGSSFDDYDAPEQVKQFPYVLVKNYYHEYPEQCYYNDYRGSSIDGYDPDLDLPSEGGNIVITQRWKLDVPYEKLVADIEFRPVKPIEYISLNFIVNHEGVSFNE